MEKRMMRMRLIYFSTAYEQRPVNPSTVALPEFFER
jgi:hypothetical protein